MAAAVYAKAIFGAFVLEGLRAGVWTGVNRGADSWTFAESPLPALEGGSLPARSSECPAAHSITQWQCPPCPECPACPDPQYIGYPQGQWGSLASGVSQLTLGFLAQLFSMAAPVWGSKEDGTGAGSSCW